MFNRFIVQNQNDKFKKLQLKDQKNSTWFKHYQTEVRPVLVSKHEKRLLGFAKRLQSNPVIIREDQKQRFKENDRRNHSQTKFYKKQKRCLTQTVNSARKQFQTKTGLSSMKQIFSQKFIDPIRQFRFRQKSKQINPPMKVGQINKKMNLDSKFFNRRKGKSKKSKTEKEEHIGNLSRSSFRSNDRMSDHLSDVDLMSIPQFYLQKKFDTYKTQKLRKQEEQLKALAGDRLYFKSLVEYERNINDKLIKNNIKKVLIKCNITKPSNMEKKQQVERDFFSQMIRQSHNY